jgi:hypothetical protein
MVTINTVFGITVLSASAWVQTRQERDSIDFVWRRLVLVNKGAAVALAAGSSQEMVVTELVTLLTSFHCIEDRLVHGDRLV